MVLTGGEGDHELVGYGESILALDETGRRGVVTKEGGGGGGGFGRRGKDVVRFCGVAASG